MRVALERCFWKCILGTVQAASDMDQIESRSCAPILIVGAPRSGTTLVQRTLLADPRVCGGQESHFFASFGQALRDFDRKRALGRPHGLACYWKRDALIARLRALWIETMGGVLEAAPGADMLVEKTPDHALWLDVISEVLPAARVVHVVRDSRAVCESLLAARHTSWGSDWAPRSAMVAARIWRTHVEAVERCRLPVHRVRYEELLADPDPVLAALWRFVGLEGDAEARAACLATARRGDAPFVGTGDLARTPPEPEGFRRDAGERGMSKASARAELGPLDRWRVWRETREAMERLGYDARGRWSASGARP